MKHLLLFLLNAYKAILSPVLHQLLGQKTLCRYPQDCSLYAKEALLTHGALKGSALALNRLFHCQPFLAYN